MALYDPEEEAFKRQLAFSDALRNSAISSDTGKMVGRHYVQKSPWVNAVEGLVSGYTGARAEQGQKELQGERERVFKEALGKRPSAMMEQAVPGTPAVTQEFPGADAFGGEGSAPITATVTPEVLPTTKQVMKPYSQQQQEMMDWATGMAGVKHPLAQSIAATGIKGAMDIPEKMMEREAAVAAKVEEAKQRHLDRVAQIEAAAAQGRITREEADKRAIEAKKEFATFASALRTPPPAQIIETTTGIYERGRDGKLVQLQDAKGNPLLSTKGGGTGSGGAKAEKSKTAVGDLLDKITAAEQGLPYASGFGAAVPSGVRQMYTDENTKMADANIASLSAEQAHALYGAAFTAAEQARAAQFLPITTGPLPDTVDTLKAKLKALRMIAEKKQARLNGQPDPHPNMYQGIIDGDTGGQSASGTIAAPKGGALPKTTNTFATEAEAAAANLPDGTPVVIGGVKGKWRK